MEMMYEERRDAALGETMALKVTELPMLIRERRQTTTKVRETALRGMSQSGFTWKSSQPGMVLERSSR